MGQNATPSVQHTHLTALRYTTQMAFQVWTPESGTHYCTPMGILETINQHFVASSWSLSYILSLMHGHMIKQKFITSIKQLLTEFPKLIFYGYIISTTVLGPLKKHLDSLK
jgi:hypothetical protein